MREREREREREGERERKKGERDGERAHLFFLELGNLYFLFPSHLLSSFSLPLSSQFCHEYRVDISIIWVDVFSPSLCPCSLVNNETVVACFLISKPMRRMTTTTTTTMIVLPNHSHIFNATTQLKSSDNVQI